MPRYSVEVLAGEPPRLVISRDHEECSRCRWSPGSPPTLPKKSSLIFSFQSRRMINRLELRRPPRDVVDRSPLRVALLPGPHRVSAVRRRTGKAGAQLLPLQRRIGPLGKRHSRRPGMGYDALCRSLLHPNPNHANQFEFNIAMPQTVGFSDGSKSGSDQDFRPSASPAYFAPPPLFLAFHLNGTWTGIGIGAKPGEYLFPALEYTGSRYAGASFYVDYLGTAPSMANSPRRRCRLPSPTILSMRSPNTRRGLTRGASPRLRPVMTRTGTTCPSFAAGPSRQSNRRLSFRYSEPAGHAGQLRKVDRGARTAWATVWNHRH